jgi:hypothetical protein
MVDLPGYAAANRVANPAISAVAIRLLDGWPSIAREAILRPNSRRQIDLQWSVGDL